MFKDSILIFKILFDHYLYMLLCTNLLTHIWTNTNLLNQHSGLIKPHPLFWYLKFNPSATKGREKQYHCLPPNSLFWPWQNKWFICGCHSILKLISIKSVLPHVFLRCLWNYQGLLAKMLTVTKSLHFHLNGAIPKSQGRYGTKSWMRAV